MADTSSGHLPTLATWEAPMKFVLLVLLVIVALFLIWKFVLPSVRR